jgi:acetolactate synthase-1/2/3 large subunit
VARLLAALDRTVPPDRILVQENGLQDMWSYFYPYWSCGDRGGSVVPSEQTALGFGAAAAVGVACAQPGRPVVALVGDGAFNLFATDLATLAVTGPAVLYLVLDNGGYGWLQANLERANGSSRFSFRTGAPGGVAGQVRAYGLGHARVTEPSQLEPVLREAWRRCAGGRTTVVEVSVDLRDVPPGLADLLGDAPAPPAAEDMVSTS